MAVWTATPFEVSTSTDAVLVVKNPKRSQAEVSSSIDVASASESAARSPGEVSTSADALQVFQGRVRADTSTSVDAIASLVQSSKRGLVEDSNSHDTVLATITHPDIGDYQFVIPVEPLVPFGAGQTIQGKFGPGSFEIRNQDSAGAVGDYRQFGTDRKTPPTWGFDLWTDMHDPGEALAWTNALAQVWDNEVRQAPEKVLPLRYRVAGRTRRVYGRPRGFSYTVDKVQLGKVYITADFVLSEDVYYDDDEESFTARMTPVVPGAESSGIILPQTLPWVFSTQPPPRTEQMIIGGTRSTWVDLEIFGPTSNPWVQINDLTWGLTGTVPDGESVILSGKPWSMGVRRSSGAAVPGWLDPRSRLSALQMKPGVYSIQFGGWDNTGTSRVIGRWRKAHPSL